MHSFSESKPKCGTIGGGTLTEPPLYRALPKNIATFRNFYYSPEERRVSVRGILFSRKLRLISRQIGEGVGEWTNFIIGVSVCARRAPLRNARTGERAREKVAMFQRRARRFIPDTLKPVPGPTTLYQVLYRAVRSAPYFVIAPLSTALAGNVLYPRVAWHEQHVM